MSEELQAQINLAKKYVPTLKVELANNNLKITIKGSDRVNSSNAPMSYLDTLAVMYVSGIIGAYETMDKEETPNELASRIGLPPIGHL